MSDLESRRRAATERILEDETLTTDLLDSPAKVLLDWGVAQAEALAEQANDLEERLDDLRHTLKHIAKQTSAEATPEAQTERVRGLLAEIETRQSLEEISAQNTESDTSDDPAECCGSSDCCPGARSDSMY